MKTLRMLTAGLLLTAAGAVAAEDTAVTTFTVTAKRLVLPAAERVPPQADVAVIVLRPTDDMPEAEIDYHVSPIGAPSAPVVERATS